MNDKSLKSFITVAEKGSFYKAAQILYTSPQSLMMQVKQLEAELDLQLLERSSKGVRLTEAGASFLVGAKEMLELAASTIETSRRIAVNPQGTIRIGIFSIPYVVPDVSLAFSEQYPDIRLSFIKVDDQTWLRFLCEGTIDVCEGADFRELSEFNLGFAPVTRDGRCIILVPWHPLAEKECISFEDLITQRVYVHNLSWLATLKKELQQRAKQVVLHELRCETQNVFEVCLNGGVFLAPVRYAHNFSPLVKRPLDIKMSWDFGLIYRLQHSEAVSLYLDVASKLYSENLNMSEAGG